MYPIGIAKDGRVIYGPYNEVGSRWTYSELDNCNGVYVGAEGTYSYAATGFFPYMIGCWGPGN